MKAKKRSVQGGMTVNAYTVLDRAVEEGIAHGWTRAHKHTDKPEPGAVKDSIEREVMNAICEFFDFEPPAESPHLDSYPLLRAAMQRALEQGWDGTPPRAQRGRAPARVERDDLVPFQLREVMAVLIECLPGLGE